MVGPALRVVIRELTENAIQYNDQPPEKRRLAVAVDAGSNVVTVTIADNGPGIPEGEFEALDQGIETAHTSSNCPGGSGRVLMHTHPSGARELSDRNQQMLLRE